MRTMSSITLPEQLGGNGQMPPLGEARPAGGAGMLQHEDGVFVYLQAVVVDARSQLFIAIEDDRLAAVLEQVRRGSRLLDDRAVGSKIAVKNRGAPFIR